MREHKKTWGPGFRFFKCDECGTEWKDVSRDCTSPSGDSCINQECNEFCHPSGYEEHYDWPTDESGNLVDGVKYE